MIPKPSVLIRLVPLALVASAAAAAAQEPAPEPMVVGAAVYKTYCAVCHGPGAKGDGPLADSLRRRPPDLTLLARKNGGQFPKEQVTRTVDGRKPARGHGGGDMPVWGDAFKQSRGGYSEAVVQVKVQAVVEHLESLQQP